MCSGGISGNNSYEISRKKNVKETPGGVPRENFLKNLQTELLEISLEELLKELPLELSVSFLH